jgi:HK97 family phage major capsid protein
VAYNDVLERGTAPSYTAGANGVDPLMPDDVSKSIIDGVIEKSAALRLFPHVPMSTMLHRFPVLQTLPDAYWINGETGLKQTSEMAWKNKFMTAEELGVVIPIPKKVLADTSYDLWSYVKPRTEEALAKKLDLAVFFGVDKPSTWPTAVGPACIDVGNSREKGTSTIDILDDINELMGLVEADGHECNGFWYANSLRKTIRGIRDANRGLLFQSNTSANGAGFDKSSTKVESLWGLPASTTKLGTFENQTGVSAGEVVELITGDFGQGMLGTRQDIEWDMLDQAVIQDGSGNIVYNLPQQGMVAMMVTCRYGFQITNPINRLNTTESSVTAPTSGDRYPFAALTADV